MPHGIHCSNNRGNVLSERTVILKLHLPYCGTFDEAWALQQLNLGHQTHPHFKFAAP